ncbi:hypothetical protein ABIC83_002829 [Roseateles asaccharophilus]|uniref:hypothetical protein n=1 Tax=Roseateles asaccharophilus TaxID=582607 RepID=UPI0038372AC1
MKKLISTALLVLASFSAAALDIKGLKVDKPVDCEAIKKLETRSGDFFEACKKGNARWYIQADFLNGKALLRLMQSPDRMLTTVAVGDFGGFSFDEALDALKVKFGPPTSFQSSWISNRMGAQFQQMEATWVDGAERLVLTRHGAEIDKPSLVYTGARAAEQSKRERDEQAKKAAGNI